MKKICFYIYVCGMCEKCFTDKIMIYKPFQKYCKYFNADDLHEIKKVRNISALINCIRDDLTENEIKKLGEFGIKKLDISSTYLMNKDYLLGFQEDKDLFEMFEYFERDELEFCCFIVAGGASLHSEQNYLFTVHPREQIHKNMPHVHVSKDNVEVRYSLDTLLPLDPLVNPHKHDNKKKIIPFLERNKDKFLEWWKLYLDGYIAPSVSDENKQFYKES